MRRKLIAAAAPTFALLATATAAGAGTVVPGQAARSDADSNGYPDAGVVVTGKYTAVYASDANGDWLAPG